MIVVSDAASRNAPVNHESDQTAAPQGNGAVSETQASHPLTPEHEAYLTARAVPVAFALEAGLRSVDGATGASLLGFERPLESGGLAMPYPSVSPPYWRIRMNDGATRYLAPAEREVPPYVPPGFDLDGTTPFVVCESPIKCLALEAAGVSAIGLGGTGTTLTTAHSADEERRLNQHWTVRTGNRRVTVLFDANASTNPNVARDQARLAQALERAGADVFMAKLPQSPTGEAWGPDDFLASHGPQALRSVLEGALPASPARAISMALAEADEDTRRNRLLDLLDDKALGVAVVVRGTKCEQHLRSLLKRSGLTKPLTDMIRRARGWLKSGSTAKAPAPYDVKGGCIVLLRGDQEEVVADFVAQIDRQLVLDDGVEKRRCFEISGVAADGTPFDTIRVSPEAFVKEAWPLTHWGASAITRPMAHGREHLAAGIQTISHPIQVSAYAHTGWREHDGQLVFLHAQGAIGPVSVDVVLDERLRKYALPTAPFDVQGAVRDALDLLEVAGAPLGHVLLSVVFRAPLQGFLYADSAVWVHGPSGALKSSLVALLMAFFGPFERENLPGSWESTSTWLEQLLFAAKDVLVVIDDFAPTTADAHDKRRAAAATVLRSIGNQSSRGRARADLTLRPNRPPRALVVGTGEDLPNGESVLARIFPVAIEKGQVDLAVLTRLQAVAHRFPHVMAGYLHYVREVPLGLELRLKERFNAIRTKAQGMGQHLRAPATIAHLALGGEMFAEFAEAIGVFTASERAAFADAAFTALVATGQAQSHHTAEADPARRFLEVLRSLLVRGEVCLLDKDLRGAATVGGGWSALQAQIIAQQAGDADATKSRTAKVVGWFDRTHVFLDPDGSYQAVVQALKAGGGSMPVKQCTLWQRLNTLGVLATEEQDRRTVKRVVRGVKTTVLMMPWSALDLDGPDPSPPDGDVCTDGGDGQPGATDPGVPVSEGNRAQVPTRRPYNDSTKPRRFRELPVSKTGNVEMNGANEGQESQPFIPGVHVHPVLLVEDTHRGIERDSEIPCACSHMKSSPPRRNGENVENGDRTASCPCPPTDLARLAETIERCGEVAISVDGPPAVSLAASGATVTLALPDGQVHVLEPRTLERGSPVHVALAATEVIVHAGGPLLGAMAARFGLRPRRVFDTNVAAMLLDEGQRGEGFVGYDLLTLARRLEGAPANGSVGRALVAVAAAQRTALCDAGLHRVHSLEQDVIPAVLHMHQSGVPVDRDALADVVATIGREVHALESELRVWLGVPKLTDKYLLPALAAIGIAVRSRGKDELSHYLDSPVARQVMLLNRQQAFLNDLGPKMIAAAAASPDGRMRPQIKQLGAVTGRFTYSEPNLQGVPKKDPRIRRCFRPAGDRVLVIGDYKAIELRVAAHVTGDATLRRLFEDGRDPHTLMAQRMTGKALADITVDERERAKPVNFGALFGTSASGLASQALVDFGLSLSIVEAERALLEYRQLFPGIAAWQADVRGAHGRVVVSQTGRRRAFSDHDPDTKRLNFPIQALAADGMKRAMALLLPDLPKWDARLVLSVHDELVLECPLASSDAAKAGLESRMLEGMAEFVASVPIEVDVGVRRDWSK
ncbi:MAG: DNA polymerase [Polyangiaceae bacterium]